MENFLDPFLEMLSAERGVSRNTLSAYKTDLKDFFQCYPDHLLEDLTETHILEYLQNLRLREMSDGTRARRLSALRHYFKFLVQENHIPLNPTAELEAPRRPKSLPKVLHEDEVEALLSAIVFLPKQEGARLQCLLEILYASGMRVSELVSLPLQTATQALAHQQPYFQILGKGNKERLVPLSEPALDALTEYLKVRARFDPKGSSPWLFPSKGKTGFLTRQGFAKMLKALTTQAGLNPDRVSPHVMRHAFATHLLNHGADLLSVQKMLGHADVATTEIYTHVMTDRMTDLVLNHHPLSKDQKLVTTDQDL